MNSTAKTRFVNSFLAGVIFLIASTSAAWGQTQKLRDRIDGLSARIESKVIEWRRDIHRHPELSNMEFKTADKIAAHLRSLGLEVKTGVAGTGVVGLLKGGKPGPVVALRADMDALPVTEATGLPFASTVRTVFDGNEVGVMHACGHDAHVAILMGVAEILASLKGELSGSVKFIFQPAEEGVSDADSWGAKLMVEQGVLANPKVDVIFGLHVYATSDAGVVDYRPEGLMASSDLLKIAVRGRQTHGAAPWQGADPVVASAQIVNSLQTIVSRRLDLTKAPAVLTIGTIHGGVRSNIVPDEVLMTGTIRSLDTAMQSQIHREIYRTVKSTADAFGVSADVEIQRFYPITYNDPALTRTMVPVLEAAAGKDKVRITDPVTIAEDFSFFQQKVPGLFFFLGGKKPGVPPEDVAPHHSPGFVIDESSFRTGVRCLSYLAVEYLNPSR